MATATGIATFVATDSAAFTWSPALTTNPPKVLACSITTTDGTVQVASLQSAPTNIGGTVATAGPMTGSILLVGSD